MIVNQKLIFQQEFLIHNLKDSIDLIIQSLRQQRDDSNLQNVGVYLGIIVSYSNVFYAQDKIFEFSVKMKKNDKDLEYIMTDIGANCNPMALHNSVYLLYSKMKQLYV
ncbi:unnamed protein product [Paramecium octaurelia]|uniref:Uncharacterized protein n=1 Tax=Paramecium octaurelia TaxID=43137 RepID=A0A8S1UP11_PAROT|nr:unnamed protein product [Paramecium octaurelia]